MFDRTLPVLLAVLLSFLSLPLYTNAYSATVPLSAEEEADLLYMREEEKLARDTYLTLYDQWDTLTIFSNIASSEQMHMDAMLKLLKRYKLADPAAGNDIGEFTNPTLQALYNTLIATGELSGLDALKVGGAIEETDMRDIVAAIAHAEQHDDIVAVYESLLCGSRNHLRSFAQLIEQLTAQPYVAQVLTQNEVDEIIESPMEKCGRKGTKTNNGRR